MGIMSRLKKKEITQEDIIEARETLRENEERLELQKKEKIMKSLHKKCTVCDTELPLQNQKTQRVICKKCEAEFSVKIIRQYKSPTGAFTAEDQLKGNINKVVEIEPEITLNFKGHYYENRANYSPDKLTIEQLFKRIDRAKSQSIQLFQPDNSINGIIIDLIELMRRKYYKK